MKILQINAVNAIGSTGRTCLEMHDYLSAYGNQCVIAYAKGPSINPLDEYLIGNNINAKLHGLMSRVSGKQGYYSKRDTIKLLDYMEIFAPDIVVLHNLHSNYINLPLLLRYLAQRNIATVAVLHDCWFYTGHCCHYTTIGCNKWQDHCGDCPSLKEYNVSWFFDTSTKMLEDKKNLFSAIPRLAVVGVSDWLTDEAKKSLVFRNTRVIQRIYNWIDTETFAPCDTAELRETMGLIGRNIILCVASNKYKKKGLYVILKLAEQLHENEKILLVGNIPKKIKMPGNVVLISQTHNAKELASYYAMADVFVQPSLEETFGKVTAEALSCGTPVVCFDSTANPELVGEGCGLVVPARDIDAMTIAVQTVLAQGKSKYSLTCRDYALEHFSEECNLRQFLDLFKNICEYQ